MTAPAVIETERLILRPWAESDREPFVAMMAEPETGYWLGGVLGRAEADVAFDRMRAFLDENGHGYWAAVVKADGGFVGRICVRRMPMEWEHPFSGQVEVGWGLARRAWGHGYASEGAAALLAWGFATLGVAEIFSFTADTNARSEAVMRRLGLTRAPDRDFDHPALAHDHPLRSHIVYVAHPPSPSRGGKSDPRT
ncbi:MAG: GNAT family N-acetyltransferase [Caulobacterales bacterium]